MNVHPPLATLEHPVLGRFELYELLGEGGQGEVYRAEWTSVDAQDHSTVAIKRLPMTMVDPKETQRLVRLLKKEAEIGRLLFHPNVVRVFSSFELDGSFYIAMEFVDGPDLKDLLALSPNRRLPPRVVAGIGIQVCEALAYAHIARNRHGSPLHLVHRDLKPANLLIDRSGSVRVVDFGVARAQEVLEDQTKTKPGTTPGTPSYMSPEQVKDEGIDGRSDLFSLGTVISEALLGRPIFTGGTVFSVIKKIGEADISKVRIDLDSVAPEFVPIVLRAMHGDPSERYQTAEAMGRDLMALYGMPPTKVELSTLISSSIHSVDSSEPCSEDDAVVNTSAESIAPHKSHEFPAKHSQPADTDNFFNTPSPDLGLDHDAGHNNEAQHIHPSPMGGDDPASSSSEQSSDGIQNESESSASEGPIVGAPITPGEDSAHWLPGWLKKGASGAGLEFFRHGLIWFAVLSLAVIVLVVGYSILREPRDAIDAAVADEPGQATPNSRSSAGEATKIGPSEAVAERQDTGLDPSEPGLLPTETEGSPAARVEDRRTEVVPDDGPDVFRSLEGTEEEAIDGEGVGPSEDVDDSDSEEAQSTDAGTPPEEEARGHTEPPEIVRGLTITFGDDPLGDIRLVVAQKQTYMYYDCFGDPEVQQAAVYGGQIAMKFTIAPDGTTNSIRVEEDTTRNPAIKRCLKRHIRNWRFTESDDGADVTWPFECDFCSWRKEETNFIWDSHYERIRTCFDEVNAELVFLLSNGASRIDTEWRVTPTGAVEGLTSGPRTDVPLSTGEQVELASCIHRVIQDFAFYHQDTTRLSKPGEECGFEHRFVFKLREQPPEKGAAHDVTP